MIRYILFILCYVSSSDPFLNGSLEAIHGNNGLFSICTKFPGDIVNDFKLVQRLDSLGVQHEYAHDYYLKRVLKLQTKIFPSGLLDDDVSIPDNDTQLQLLEEVLLNENSSAFIRNGTFYLDSNIFNGGHGEIWRAHHISSGGRLDLNASYVLKRMNVKDRPHILRCALREIYYGEKFKDNSKVARFISYFIVEEDYWLVFRDEGVSLQQLLYAVTVHGINPVLEPSSLWRKMRTSDPGGEGMRGVLHQLILCLIQLHSRGITHRDVKPSNILLNAEKEPKLLIADFSSAVSKEAITLGLYGDVGPTTKEESPHYMPPEAMFSEGVPYDVTDPASYDSWSVGVVFLEMILGTAHVFSVDQRTAALISHRLRLADEAVVEQAMLLAALADYCIYKPVEDESLPASAGLSAASKLMSSTTSGKNLLSRKRKLNVDDKSAEPNVAQVAALLRPVASTSRCGIAEFSHAIQRRDPLGLGYHDPWGLHLLSQLLAWNTSQRISLQAALEHAYFTGPYRSTLDDSLHATRAQRRAHDLDLVRRYDGEGEADVESGDGDDGDDAQALAAVTDGLSVDGDEEPGDDTEREQQVHTITSLKDPVRYLLSLTTPTLLRPRHHPANETWWHATSHPTQLQDFVTEESPSTRPAPLPKSHKYHHPQSHHPQSHHQSQSFHTTTSDPTCTMNFTCPHCGRVFHGDWHSCDSHVRQRRHGDRCLYDPSSHELPPCLSEHAMLPLDAQSGWCDLQGRRKHIEDAHTVVFAEDYKYLAVFDGHFGSRAAKFASRHLHEHFDEELRLADGELVADEEDAMQYWSHVEALSVRHKSPSRLVPPQATEEVIQFSNTRSAESNAEAGSISAAVSDGADVDGKHGSTVGVTAARAVASLHRAFTRTHETFLSTHSPSDKSGSTATVAVLFERHLMVGHVGDSRAVLCCDDSGSAVSLTEDHTPYSVDEAERVRSAGGFIEHYGVLRVNGKLAVTRSLGDREPELRAVLTEKPDVVIFRLSDHDSVQNIGNASEGSISSLNDRSGVNGVNDMHSKANPVVDRLSPCLRYNRLLDEFNLKRPGIRNVLFLVVGSDGIWDVMTNQAVVDFVCEKLENSLLSVDDEDSARRLPASAMHETSRMLAQEAFVRGSMDNIGVCIVGLQK